MPLSRCISVAYTQIGSTVVFCLNLLYPLTTQELHVYLFDALDNAIFANAEIPDMLSPQ